MPLAVLSCPLSSLSCVRALSEDAGNSPRHWHPQTALLSWGMLLFPNSVMAPTSQRIPEPLRLENPSKMIKCKHSPCSAKPITTPWSPGATPTCFWTLPGKVAGPKVVACPCRCRAHPAHVVPVWELEPGWHTAAEPVDNEHQLQALGGAAVPTIHPAGQEHSPVTW